MLKKLVTDSCHAKQFVAPTTSTAPGKSGQVSVYFIHRGKIQITCHRQTLITIILIKLHSPRPHPWISAPRGAHQEKKNTEGSQSCSINSQFLFRFGTKSIWSLGEGSENKNSVASWRLSFFFVAYSEGDLHTFHERFSLSVGAKSKGIMPSRQFRTERHVRFIGYFFVPVRAARNGPWWIFWSFGGWGWFYFLSGASLALFYFSIFVLLVVNQKGLSWKSKKKYTKITQQKKCSETLKMLKTKVSGNVIFLIFFLFLVIILEVTFWALSHPKNSMVTKLLKFK